MIWYRLPFSVKFFTAILYKTISSLELQRLRLHLRTAVTYLKPHERFIGKSWSWDFFNYWIVCWRKRIYDHCNQWWSWSWRSLSCQNWIQKFYKENRKRILWEFLYWWGFVKTQVSKFLWIFRMERHIILQQHNFNQLELGEHSLVLTNPISKQLSVFQVSPRFFKLYPW